MVESPFEEIVTLLSADDRVARALLRRGLRRALSSERFGEAQDVIEPLLAEIDRAVGQQLDVILHDPRFQALEAAWRGLKLIVDRTDYRQNIKTEFLNCSKDDLVADFEDAPDVGKSGLYKLTYSAEYGPFGGRPYAALVVRYELGPSPVDQLLLSRCAQVCARTAAPFLASAHPSLFGGRTLEQVAGDHAPPHEEPAWEAFRRTKAARFAALVLGRVLLRAPFVSSSEQLVYQESVSRPQDRLWGSGADALAICLARSFAARRLASHIEGPLDGMVAELPTWSGPDDVWLQPAAVEAHISDERANELVAAGVVPLQAALETNGVLFQQVPTTANQARPSAMTAADLERQLPATLFLGRMLHYIKVIQREMIGTWQERARLEAELREFWTPYLGSAPVTTNSSGERAPLSADEWRLLRDLMAHKSEPALAAIYADWLEERGQTRRSQFLRAQARYMALADGDPDQAEARLALQRASEGLEPGWHGAVSCTPASIPITRTIAKRIALEVVEVAGNLGWFGLELEVELNCTIAQQPGVLRIQNYLDRE